MLKILLLLILLFCGCKVDQENYETPTYTITVPGSTNKWTGISDWKIVDSRSTLFSFRNLDGRYILLSNFILQEE